jgi:ureidoglycolate hydrolase
MSAPENILEIHQHDGPSYKPLVDFEAWRVALLNFSDDLLPENLTRMQRHNETDEVFVLLAGSCVLFVGEGTESVTRIHAERLQPGQLYNVKRAVWHTHTLSTDAKVLVVENRETTYDNSPFIPLSEAQHRQVMEMAAAIRENTRAA